LNVNGWEKSCRDNRLGFYEINVCDKNMKFQIVFRREIMAETDLQIKVIDALRELYTVISAMQQS